MATLIHLDTHVVVWLYMGEVRLFPATTLDLLDKSEWEVSPMVQLELAYLYEVGKLTVSSEEILSTIIGEWGARFSRCDFADLVREAVRQTWTRDPFDRMLVANAMLEQKKLVTKDRLIRKHFKNAVWD